MGVQFKRAVKAESFLRMALIGPSGAGKTYTALSIASLLADGKPVAVIDTERGSASKYADLFGFDVLELDSFHPDRYIEAIQVAAAAGYGVVVIDSLTHAWKGQGGLLEVHEQIVKRQKTPNSYTAWAEVTPIQNRLIAAITSAPLHVIATMRSKTEYVQDRNERGGTTIRKVGMAPEQRDGMEFEFDIVGDLDQDNTMVVSKSRCPALSSAVIAKPGAQVADTLMQWLRGERVERPAVTPAAPATTQATTPATTRQRAAKTTPAAASAPLPTWNGGIRIAALEAGYKHDDDYIAMLRKVTGKSDKRQYTDADKRLVLDFLADKPRGDEIPTTVDAEFVEATA